MRFCLERASHGVFKFCYVGLESVFFAVTLNYFFCDTVTKGLTMLNAMAKLNSRRGHQIFREAMMKRRTLIAQLLQLGFAVLFWGLGVVQGQPEAWQIIDTMEDAGWQAIHFFDSLNGFIASPSIQPYCLMRTRNGGYDWEGVDCTPNFGVGIHLV